MKDLIERQAVIDALGERPMVWMDSDYEIAQRNQYDMDKLAIETVPSAQPEIIHCRDCKYWQDQQEGVIEISICARPENKYEKLPFRFMIGEDGFCSYAERRTDDSISD